MKYQTCRLATIITNTAASASHDDAQSPASSAKRARLRDGATSKHEQVIPPTRPVTHVILHILWRLLTCWPTPLSVPLQHLQSNSRVRLFLANVNSRSRSLYAVARPSVVCLSVVCNVRAPYSGGSNFRQYFYGVRYPGHPLTSTEKFAEIVPGESLRRGS